MVTSIDDSKRTAIATRLADMKLIQNLIIDNDRKLIGLCDDEKIRKILQEMLEDDQRNIKVLDDVLVRYGVRSEPEQKIQKMVEEIKKLMDSDELSVYDKVTKHELLKHGQTMTGLLIHKAAQVVGLDIDAAIAPLNTVNFENRAHQEQLKGMMEVFGVRELTGQDADQGLWARVQDAVAALTGVVGSAMNQPKEKVEMTIQDAIRTDHQKVSVLFMELQQSDNPEKIQEYFGQIYKDLNVHAEAEEQVVYPTVRSFYGENDTQELYDEQAEMKQVLNSIKSMDPSSSQFKAEVKKLMDAVMDHVRQEESTMFAAIRNNCSVEQQKQLAEDFTAAKDQLQQKMAVKK